MPNGKNLINEMDYQERIKIMPDRQLSEFTATKVYETLVIVQNNVKRISKLESKDRKTFGLTGGIGGVIGAAIAVFVEFFIRRG